MFQKMFVEDGHCSQAPVGKVDDIINRLRYEDLRKKCSYEVEVTSYDSHSALRRSDVMHVEYPVHGFSHWFWYRRLVSPLLADFWFISATPVVAMSINSLLQFYQFIPSVNII